MKRTKRGTAITGDLFTISHPTLDLSAPFTSHVDVVFDGVTHQVITTADDRPFGYTAVTGSFVVGDLQGHIVESMDQVSTQAAHRYQAIVRTDRGALTTATYTSSAECMRLIGALRPTPTPLGVMIEPTDEVHVSSEARVAVTTAVGVIDLAPLESSVIDALPQWSGTPSRGGELYRGEAPERGLAWLTLVSDTARAIVMPAATTSHDELAAAAAELEITWTT